MAILTWADIWGEFSAGSEPAGGVNAGVPVAPRYSLSGFQASGNAPGTLPFAARSEVWFAGFYGATTSASSRDPNQQILGFYSGAQALFRLAEDSAETNWEMQIRDGSAWQTLFAVTAAAASNFDFMNARLEIRIRIAEADGVVELRRGATVLGSYTGDTRRTAATTCDSVRVQSQSAFSARTWYGVFLTDEEIAGIRYVNFLVAGDGSLTGWTGAATAAESHESNNTQNTVDGTFIVTGVVDDIRTLNLASFSGWNDFGGGSYDIMGIGVTVRARHAAGGAGSVRPVLRHGGANAEGLSFPLGEAFDTHRHFFATNPSTGAAWQHGDMDATGETQVGVKSVAA